MLSPCPTGWKSEPDESVELIDYAVRCGLFPLYEVYNGDRYRLNARPDGTPVEQYTKRQKRYTSAHIDPESLVPYIEAQTRRLAALEKAFPYEGD
jgi:pyruvate/2-oxoacid:ferredoxin oxidoreductase beta subunit